ncbi:Mitogen-activated protein kinase kinase kinase YODA [Botrytis cinerea]
MAGAVDDGWTMVIGQPASEIREEKQIEEWERSKGGWSGFGKHPQNWTDHKKLHLSSEKELGSGSYGLVERVTYGAVTMARKHVIPRGGMTVEKLREEANAMEELAHKHILKLVGTYTYKRKNLYLLLYPAATCDLSTFLDDIEGIRSDTCADRDDAMKRLYALGLKDIGKIDDLCMLRRPILPSDHSTHIKRTETALGFLQQLMGCVTEALLFVHEKGVRHRDLKPKNILLSPGRVYLADFGIARDVKDSDNSITCGRYGTASWIAPEVYDGEYHHMSSADVFSLDTKMRTISESSLSSKSRIAELETENITLRERLAILQNKDQTYELRIEHERNHAKKQNDVLKERYEKQLKAQTDALIRAEERINALELNSPTNADHHTLEAAVAIPPTEHPTQPTPSTSTISPSTPTPASPYHLHVHVHLHPDPPIPTTTTLTPFPHHAPQKVTSPSASPHETPVSPTSKTLSLSPSSAVPPVSPSPPALPRPSHRTNRPSHLLATVIATAAPEAEIPH